MLSTAEKSSSLAGWLPIAAIVAAVCLWGGSFSIMRVLVRTLSSWSVVWLRMAIGLLCVLPFRKKLYSVSYKKGDWKILLPMVLFQPCLYFFLESNALRFTTSSQAGVVSALVPLMVALGAWVFLSEAISRKTIIGLLLSIAGVVLLTIFGRADEQAANPVLGNLMEVGAMAAAAANMLIIKKLSHRYNPWALTALQTLAGFVFFMPGFFLLFQADPSLWNWRIILSLVYLGAFVTLGAFGMYNWGMSRIPASSASVFINLIPVIAVFIGWIALQESLAPAQFFSALLVIGGVWLSQISWRRRRTGRAAL